MIHTFTRSHVHTFTRSHVHTFTRSHVHTYARSHVHTFTRSHVHTFTRSHVQTFTRSHVHITLCLQRLEHLILTEIPESEGANPPLSSADTESLKTVSRYYDELVSLWRSLALAAQEKRLAPSDIKKVQAAVDAATAKGVRCMPGADRCVWSWSQCADVQAAAATVDAATAAGRVDSVDECLAARSFHEAGLMMDVGASSSEWPLSEVCEGMRLLLKPSSSASVAAAAVVVSWFSVTQPRVPTALQLRCFSLGLWLIIKPKLGRDALQPLLPDAAVTAASAALEATSPNLRVYCNSGPGIGSSAFPARWLCVWKEETGDGVTPILMDEVPTNSGTNFFISAIGS
jgi:hypothetical protein